MATDASRNAVLTVTEMTPIRHALAHGIRVQTGVEMQA